MPNWCSNTLCLQHEDPEMIARAKRGFDNGSLLEEFIPVPQDLKETISGSVSDPDDQAALVAKTKANIEKHGYGNWYDFCVNEWGTKWDVGGDNDVDISPDGLVMSVCFDSAWAPPVAAYEKLQDMGFQVNAYYYEPGMGFCGKWTSEDGDAYYEVSSDDSIEDIERNIPSDILEAFNIIDDIQSWQESEEELGDIDDAEDSEHDEEGE